MNPHHARVAAYLLPIALLACHAGLHHDHSRLPAASAPPIAPGAYELLLVSTSGRREGQRVLGRMTLHPTSPDDVSPRTGERPRPRSDRHFPLYGTTDLRFEDVNAPVLRGQDVNAPVREDELIEPAPSSTDRIYPGILVDTDCRHDGVLHTCLWIGSLANRRAGPLGLDGAGIVLWIEWMDGPAYGGVWTAAGIVGGDTGTWTAKRLRVQPR